MIEKRFTCRDCVNIAANYVIDGSTRLDNSASEDLLYMRSNEFLQTDFMELSIGGKTIIIYSEHKE